MMTIRNTMMTMMAAACFAGASAAEAQLQPPQQAQPQQTDIEAQRTQILQELNALREQGIQVQSELTAIAQKAAEANPSLMGLHGNLVTVYQSKLTEYGHPSEEELQELRVMQQKLQTPGAEGMDEAERRRLTDQFNAEVAKLQEAELKAQNDPAVKQAQAEFDQTRLETMQQLDPKTMDLQRKQEDLQAHINRLQQSLQSLLQQTPQQ
jgi:hypothetical protein